MPTRRATTRFIGSRTSARKSAVPTVRACVSRTFSSPESGFNRPLCERFIRLRSKAPIARSKGAPRVSGTELFSALLHSDVGWGWRRVAEGGGMQGVYERQIPRPLTRQGQSSINSRGAVCTCITRVYYVRVCRNQDNDVARARVLPCGRNARTRYNVEARSRSH